MQHPRPRSILTVLVLVCLLGASAPTQYSHGDVLVTDYAGAGPTWTLWGITRFGRLYTAATLPFRPWAVAPGPDNRDIWVTGDDQTNYYLSRVARNGAVTHIHVDRWNFFSSIDVDGSGDVLLGNLVAKEILKYNTTYNHLSTILAGSRYGFNGGGLDLATGDLVVMNASHHNILRAQLQGKPAYSTLNVTLSRAINLAGIHADPATGDLIGSWAIYPSAQSTVYRIVLGPQASLVPLRTGAPFAELGALDRDPFDGQYVIPSCRLHSPNQVSSVFRFDARTGAITTMYAFPPSATAQPLASTVASSRHLCAMNEPRYGTTWKLLVSSPAESGALYVIGLSFGFRPGIPVGGRAIHLVPDALFWMSLQNTGIFSGFLGHLDIQGEATATLAIPALWQLSGVRFYAVAVTLRNQQISVISEPLGVQIR